MYAETLRILKHSRPRFWLYLLGPVLVAGVAAQSSFYNYAWFWIFLLFTTVPANIFLYGVNDLFDRDTDKHNEKKTKKEAKAKYNDTGLILSVIASGILSLILFIFLPQKAMISFGLFIVLSIFYSAPPLRFKAKPFIDSFSNVLYILPGVALYTTLTGTHPVPLAIISGWAWTAAMHLFSAIPDIEPDKKAGLRTTAIVLGQRESLLFCSFLWAVSVISSWPLLPTVFNALSLLYPISALVPLYTKEVTKQYWLYPYINGLIGFALFLSIALPSIV